MRAASLLLRVIIYFAKHIALVFCLLCLVCLVTLAYVEAQRGRL